MAAGESCSTCADHKGLSKSKPLCSSSVARPPSRTCKPVRSSCWRGVIQKLTLLLIHSGIVREHLQGFSQEPFGPRHPTNRKFGEWLSLVEHLVRDQGVGGSNPLSPTISSLCLVLLNQAITTKSQQLHRNRILWKSG